MSRVLGPVFPVCRSELRNSYKKETVQFISSWVLPEFFIGSLVISSWVFLGFLILLWYNSYWKYFKLVESYYGKIEMNVLTM